MFKTITLLFFCFLVIENSATAETCPSIDDLKQHHLFRNWQPYDLENGELLSDQERSTFLENITGFDRAAWLDDAPEGPAECFYTGADVYLAQQNLKPDLNTNNWQPVSINSMECHANNTECFFSYG